MQWGLESKLFSDSGSLNFQDQAQMMPGNAQNHAQLSATVNGQTYNLYIHRFHSDVFPPDVYAVTFHIELAPQKKTIHEGTFLLPLVNPFAKIEDSDDLGALLQHDLLYESTLASLKFQAAGIISGEENCRLFDINLIKPRKPFELKLDVYGRHMPILTMHLYHEFLHFSSGHNGGSDQAARHESYLVLDINKGYGRKMLVRLVHKLEPDIVKAREYESFDGKLRENIVRNSISDLPRIEKNLIRSAKAVVKRFACTGLIHDNQYRHDPGKRIQA